MRRVLALALLLLAVPAPAAGALTYREQRALDVAREKWKRLPCGGAVVIAWVPDDQIANEQAEAVPPCTIHLALGLRDRAVWPNYCTVIVHEIGHLLGVGHSPDPRSVMYPSPRNYWRCNHSPAWSLAHPG